MKRYSAFFALLVALLFGTLAVILANKWIAGHSKGNDLLVNSINSIDKIVVAAEDISVGAQLTEDNLVLADWPKDLCPKGSFSDIETVKGRVAIGKLVAGEPLLAAELAAPGSGVGLVAMIPKGMRAMSIKVDEVIGVAGFILPNTFVDIISVKTKGGNKEKDSVETILKQIKVLAIAQETFTEGGNAKVVRTVTLQVTPRQGENLALETNKGQVHLVLRNPLDGEEEQVAVEESPKESPKEVIPVIEPKIRIPKMNPFDIEVIRGNEREKLRFKNYKSAERV